MRCKYCGSKIHVKDEVCKGCSAPVRTVNYAAGWALALSVFSFLLSGFGTLNIPLLVLTLLLIILGFQKAKKRDGKGKRPSVWAIVVWILAVAATVILICCYQMYQTECLKLAEEFLDSFSLAKETRQEYWQTFQQWFDYMSFHFLMK